MTLKILIADDEKFIRKGIIAILSRNLEYDLRFVEAKNGEEALEIASAETPDLIITDIYMPACDGLEFVRQIRNINIKTPVIILSGYENFDYAKQAIRLGVREYVMKPINKTEFLFLIQSYVDEIIDQRKRVHEEHLRKRENQKIVEKLKRDFLLGLLKCANSEEAREYLDQLEKLGIQFASCLYLCVVIQYKIQEENKEFIDFVVKNILDEFWGWDGGGDKAINVIYCPGTVVSIFEEDSHNGLLEQKKKKVRNAVALLKKHIKAETYGGIGAVSIDTTHLHTSLEQALLAANFKVFEKGDSVCVYQDIPGEDKEYRSESYWESAERMDVFKILDEFQKIAYSKRTKAVLKRLERDYEGIQKRIGQKNGKMGEEYCPFSQIWSISQAKQELKERLEVSRELCQETKTFNEVLMKQVLEFVDEHITEEIDLNLVAQHFHRTAGYISTLFKRYVKGGFSAYLTEKRIKTAKKLLRNKAVSIQEVGELCGYSNSKYFSVVFKKSTGMTPREYRDSDF